MQIALVSPGLPSDIGHFFVMEKLNS